MKRVVFEFPDEGSALSFLAWFSDGGGESSFFDGQEYSCDDGDHATIRRFDYKRAFTGWGYDPEKHGPDLTVEAQPKAD